MKIALAHDFLIRWGGAEKVLFDFHKIFPEAPIFTLFHNEEFTKEKFPGVEIKSSYLQKKYQRNKNHRRLAPFMPIAVEDLDFSGYDLVISSTSGFMKGIVVPTKTKHICYLHTPTRWAWQDYFEETRFNSFLKRLYVHFYRLWDYGASQRPDVIIANSKYTKDRIQKYYRRDSQVIYPSVEIKSSHSSVKDLQIQASNFENYFVIVSRLVDYKHIDWAIKAFSKLKYKLVIIGEGPEYENLKFKIQLSRQGSLGSPGGSSNQKLKDKIILKRQIKNKNNLLNLVRNSIGLIHLAEEDFGIAMIEALRLGKPVIAYNRGGAREIIKSGINGELFEKDNLKEQILKVAENIKKYKIINTKKTASKFSENIFRKKIEREVACK